MSAYSGECKANSLEIARAQTNSREARILQKTSATTYAASSSDGRQQKHNACILLPLQSWHDLYPRPPPFPLLPFPRFFHLHRLHRLLRGSPPPPVHLVSVHTAKELRGWKGCGVASSTASALLLPHNPIPALPPTCSGVDANSNNRDSSRRHTRRTQATRTDATRTT